MLAQLLFLLLILFGQTAFSNEVVRISTGEWSPFISEHLENKGILAHITKEAFAVKGVDVQYGFFPWARATQFSKTGEWDGTIAFVRLKEREPFYLFSDPIYVGHYAFFHLKSTPFSWNDYADLKDKLIASTIGFGGMGDRFIEAEKKGVIKVLRLLSDVQSFNMLMAKRAAAVPSDVEVGYVLAKKLYGEKANLITHNDHYIHRAEYHLVISKKIKHGQDLINKFNKGLAQLRKSGRYQEILKSWYEKPIYKDAVPREYLKLKR
ncbi:substrate-binding periplasmic protein [Bdellovibrio bacteriovorus]